MRTITTTSLTIKIFDAKTYLHERKLMQVTANNNNVIITLTIDNRDIFSLMLPARGVIYTIDMTDIVKTYPNPSTATLTDNITTADITWYNDGLLINPYDNTRPRHNIQCNILGYDDSRGNLIFAPAVMYAGDTFVAWSGGKDLIIDIPSSGEDSINAEIYDYPTLPTDDVIRVAVDDDITNSIAIPLRNTDDGRRYCALRWECMYKAEIYKSHTFVLSNYSYESDNVTECYNIIDAGTARMFKNRVCKATLLLEGLTPYDVWYYSDLITSNNAYYSDIIDGERVSTERRVQVLSKSISTTTNSTKRVDITIDILIKAVESI